MIVDLSRFIEQNRPNWRELDAMVSRLEDDPHSKLSLEDARKLHYLYERCSADLARIDTFSAEPETRRYLSEIVGRAYAEIYETRRKNAASAIKTWFLETWPATVRRHSRALAVSLALTMLGTVFGAFAIAIDSDAKTVLMPFSALQGEPGDRVKREEAAVNSNLTGHKSTFSAELMTHNTRVALFTLALGISWGIGSSIMLFYNGVILGAVAFDYIRAGYTAFLLGWLMPHGVVEIPAIILAGQASYVIAAALIGYGDRTPRAQRLRAAGPDLATMAFGCGVMLIWAGIIEAFVSQYHQPVLPYAVKISFGAVELIVLIAFFTLAGRGTASRTAAPGAKT